MGELASLAAFDPLTGLPDRQTFFSRLQQAIMRSRREPDYRFAVCFLDLDGFKAVNRRFGHVAGDLFLREAALRLRRAIRRRDLLARYGGDEFTALLGEVSDEASALRLAERFTGRLRRALVCGKRKARISVSIGVVLCSSASRTPKTILRCADKAMFLAKAQGGNQAVLYRPERCR